MDNKKHYYWENDDVTFRGSWKIDGIAQTIDSGSGLIRIMERKHRIPYLPETSATISGTQISKKVTNLIKGTYRLFFTASFGSGADQRTGIIDFVVRTKEAR
jgi:hypothetical protein